MTGHGRPRRKPAGIGTQIDAETAIYLVSLSNVVSFLEANADVREQYYVWLASLKGRPTLPDGWQGQIAITTSASKRWADGLVKRFLNTVSGVPIQWRRDR